MVAVVGVVAVGMSVVVAGVWVMAAASMLSNGSLVKEREREREERGEKLTAEARTSDVHTFATMGELHVGLG